MSFHPSSRLPARIDEDDEELGLDRPSRETWRDPYLSPERARSEDGEAVDVRRGRRTVPAVDLASRGIGLLLKLTLLLILLAVLWGLVSFMGTALRTPGAITEQIGGALQRGAGVVGAAGQRVADTF